MAWRVLCLAGERLEREEAALARLAAGAGGALAAAFLGERIPLAAALAFALPAAIGGAAVLADEAEVAPGHGERFRIRCSQFVLTILLRRSPASGQSSVASQKARPMLPAQTAQQRMNMVRKRTGRSVR